MVRQLCPLIMSQEYYTAIYSTLLTVPELRRGDGVHTFCSRILGTNVLLPQERKLIGKVNTFKFSWDRISGIHCLLLPQHYEIRLG